MGDILQRISDIANRITEGLLVVILSGMAVVVFLQVIFRYLLNLPLFWTEEFARYSLVWASLLGSAVAVKRGQHIAVTIFMDRLPKALRRGLTIFALISVATILAIIVIGLTTPPVGVCLFIACSIGQTNLERLSRAILPFLLASIAVLLICTYWEALVLAIPVFFGYKPL
jgi:uncharacterized RDD family membrane protein YckC